MSEFTDVTANYELKKVLVVGEIYEIRQCKNLRTHESLTVKVYRKHDLTDVMYEMIQRELDLLKRIEHPNIITVHNVLEDIDKVYIFIDEIHGQDLFSYIITKKNLSEIECATIAS